MLRVPLLTQHPTLSSCLQHYVMLNEEQKNRKLNDLLDALDFNQVRQSLFWLGWLQWLGRMLAVVLLLGWLIGVGQ